MPDHDTERNEFLAKYENRLVNPKSDPGFEDVWPSESRGDGKIRKNNSRTGGAQGKGTLLRKAPCQLCGFINDLNAIDHTGGSLDGNGAYSNPVPAVATSPVSGPPSILGAIATHTENYADQTLGKNNGCGNCGSKNSTDIRTIIEDASPFNSPNTLGF